VGAVRTGSLVALVALALPGCGGGSTKTVTVTTATSTTSPPSTATTATTSAVNPPGAGRFVCAGDTTLDPRAAPLAYGTDAQVGSIRCASRTDGMTCTNETNSHGFFISFARYRAF
jgi:hypothetical protein